MRSTHSAQRKVELQRLGNQLPVLGKAISFCKMVTFCGFCLFVKLRLSPGRVGTLDKDIPGYRNSVKILVASIRSTKAPVAPPWRWDKNTNSRFSRFFVRSVPLFRSLCPAFSFADVDTYVYIITANVEASSLCAFVGVE